MDSEKLAELRNYYKDELTIIGFNDLEVVSNASSFFKKSLLDNLADILRSEEVEPTIIDCFSSLMNKTEHINYYLKSNLSIEEIKLSNVYSSVLSLEKFMVNRHLPKALGKIGYLSTFKNLVNMDDDVTCITSVLEEASSPIIIYSSGYSNLKREIDFDGVNTPKNYDYTLSKIKSKKTLSKVIGGIEKNFYSILSINDKSDIYVLNAPITNSLDEIKNLVISFNDSLYNLCNQYNLNYIDRNVTDNTPKSLSEEIISALYINKFITERKQVREYSDYSYNSKGALGIMDKAQNDWREIQKLALEKEGYEREYLLGIVRSHKDEYDVFDKVQKVLTKRKKRYSPRIV